MTETEHLRQLLDERGVDWDYGITGPAATRFNANGVDVTFTPILDGLVCSTILTPEQAVEATLGRGTCRKVRAWEDDPRGGGGWVLVCSECDELLANDGEDGEFDGPNYCPNCGRRVEQ